MEGCIKTLVGIHQVLRRICHCYENRRQTHTVIPAKAGIHRDEEAHHFHLPYVAL